MACLPGKGRRENWSQSPWPAAIAWDWNKQSNNEPTDVFDDDLDTTDRCPVRRANTEESYLSREPMHSQTSSHDQRSHSLSYSTSLSSMAKAHRKGNLRLPSFSSLRTLEQLFACDDHSHPPDPRNTTAPLLTPPPDDPPLTYFGNIVSTSPSSPDPSETSRSQHQALDRLQSPMKNQLGLNLSQSYVTSNQSSMQHYTWVMKSADVIVSSLNASLPTDSIQVVSQTLPSQARDSRTRPTFEEVVGKVQLGLNYVPFITITHAVPQARSMDELPKTPPSTPRPMRRSEDYFSDNQMIFSHAAVVPIYHNHGPATQMATRVPHNISAPNVQISILERYIPPTMPQEISDFFDCGSKESYLSDRLSELSPNKGSLLLVYPTRAGGLTFAQKYVGPLLDPFLRQFTLLNNLTSDAAAAMGTMMAVKAMLEFEEMKTRLEQFCQALTEGPPMRGQRSRFVISHGDKTEVTLDRSSWMNWFVEQEHPRLRQNLVEYHQSGGRMPDPRDNKEVTVGMLAREVIEGIKRSREPTGGVGIEVGVFVITRTSLS